jgi:anhydro-N-acetylmuramic acid kinase
MEAPFSTDAKEAILFAILANQCVAGNGTDFGEPAPNLPATGMGKISLPA